MMATANTYFVDLCVTTAKITEKNVLKRTIEDVMVKFIPELKLSYSRTFKGGGFLSVYSAVRDTFVTVRGFPRGLVTINVECYKEDGNEPLMSFKKLRQLEAALTKHTGSVKSHNYPPLKRGLKADRYFYSSDERFLEFDIDDILFDQQSQYQRVQVVHSISLGNMLILDGCQNISEHDLVYTETVMQKGKEDYTNKEIVILGGGDGGILHELLKSKPKYVTMLELDEVVIQACRKYLRGCCGDSMDQMEGSNYKIVVGDCVKSLDQFIAEGKTVDYVFGDLTDMPVCTDPDEEIWNFIRLILNKSFQILKPTGKYMTHGSGVSSPSTLQKFEEQFKSLGTPVEFTSVRQFVPPFLEEWVFYQIWKKEDNK